MNGKVMEIVVGIAMIATLAGIVGVIANNVWSEQDPATCQCSCRGESE